MNYYNNPITDRFETTPLNRPPPYAQSSQQLPASYVGTRPVPLPSYPNNGPLLNNHVPSSYSRNGSPVSYSSAYPPTSQRPLSSSASRESFQSRDPSATTNAQSHYNGLSNYATSPRNYSPDSRKNGPPHKESTAAGAPDLGSPPYTSSPRQKYRTVEDYHYDYRGGFRPIQDSDSRDGYTTDGSGSGIREGSVRGFENFKYPAERESLLSGERNPFFATRSNGTSYGKGNFRFRRPLFLRGSFGGMRRARGHGGLGEEERRPFVRGSLLMDVGLGDAPKSGENQPFLGGVEPVRLTPSWEQRDVSKEELNFKNVKTYENFELDVEPPTDKYALVFLTLVLHGVGTLMPWNMFITAKNYFVNYKLGTASVDTSEYTTNFLPYLGYASQVPNVLFNWINIFVQMGGGLTTRIVGSILIEVVIFIVTVVLAMVDSSDWPGIFFWVTMASVIVLNVANGIYQNTIYGLAARLPFKYTGAVVLGSNISGTFTALINIAAIAMAPNQRTSAIYYFITALFVLLACFDTYFALPLNRFYRYHEAMHEKTQKQALRASTAEGKTKKSGGLPVIWHVFKKSFPQQFNVFMVFFVTLAVFPAVLADTCRTNDDFFISSKYFQAVTCFLTFNVFAMLGNMLPGLLMWPGPKFLCIPVLLRILFIPAFVLCHYYPYDVERIMPVLIDSDLVYWILGIFLGLTSGYYSSLAMMYCPRTVEPEHAPMAGMMGAASLITGIFAGINFQVVCSYAVTHISFDIPGFENSFRNCTDRTYS